jgi:uncharacterized protein (TIGR03000 family)
MPESRPAEKIEAAPKAKGSEGALPAKAKVIVELPAADAKLIVDGRETKPSTETRRVFNTPDLEPGREYFYTMRVEYTRDGQPVTETRRVVVRAGAETVASFAPQKSDQKVAKTASK